MSLQQSYTTTNMWLLILLTVSTCCCLLGADAAFEFKLIRSSTTDACINFRSSSTAEWGYVSPSGITARSAEVLCQSFYPSAATGVMTTSHWGCIPPTSGSYRYTTTIDCHDKSLPTSGCDVTGNMNPVFQTTTFSTAGISCIRVPAWSGSSSYSLTGTSAIISGGVYGQQISRTVSLQSDVTSFNIRPNSQFSIGTVCLPTSPPPGQNPKGTNIANALCRTAGLHGSIHSTIENGTYSNTGMQRYVSNIVCDSETDTTLWNSGCSFTTNYYNNPATTCSDAPPRVSCPITFDMKLSDPIVAPYNDYEAFQLVQLRPEGTDTYDGIMCVYSSYTANFANVICHEMYGEELDFAFAYTGTGPSLPLTTSEYMSSVLCDSNSNTSISHCTATVTPKSQQYPCSTYRGMVSCKIIPENIIFSLAKTISSDAPGSGKLMAIVTTTDETTARNVCFDGFDKTAALAACRSVGYTPGAAASFSLSGSAFSHTINNVSCPPGANKLTNCKLQYSGRGYKIPNNVQSQCSGAVYIDCDLGTPLAEFRMTANRYLQARLYDDAEWGWVKVASSVTTKQGYDAMCQHSTSSTGNVSISKTFLSVTSCPSSTTQFRRCQYTYLNGDALSRSFHCGSDTTATTTTGGPSNSNNNEEGPSEDGMSFGATFGLAMGVPMGVIFFVVFGVIGYCVFCRKPVKTDTDTDAGRSDDASSSGHGELHIELSSNPTPDQTNFNGGIYGGNNSQAANQTTTTFSRSNGGGGGVQFHQQGPPMHTSYSQPQTGIYPQQQAYPQQQFQFGGGDIYNTQQQPVMGTPFVASPYPLGVPGAPSSSSASSRPQPHYDQPSCGDASSTCKPAPYGRGNYDDGCQ